MTPIPVMISRAQGRAEIETIDWRLSEDDRKAAFVRLAEAHHADLVPLAYVICGDRELAADCMVLDCPPGDILHWADDPPA
jgi:hypothetical protein